MTTSKTLPHGLINAYQVDYQSGYLYTDDRFADRRRRTGHSGPGGRAQQAVSVYGEQLRLRRGGVRHRNRREAVSAEYLQHHGKPAHGGGDRCGGQVPVCDVHLPEQRRTAPQLYTPANPGPGGITIFPINSDNTLCTLPACAPFTVNVGRNPIGIATSSLLVPAGTSGCTVSTGCPEVFVIEQDSATSSNLLGFVENPTTGGLTPLPGVAINSGNVASTGFSLEASPNGITMGSSPSGILVNPAGTDLYVTDQVANGITTLSVGTNGVPSVAGTTRPTPDRWAWHSTSTTSIFM